VEHAAAHGRELLVRAEDYPPPLRQVRSSFVTLRTPADELRGCIGTCWPRRSLVVDVASNACAAAIYDPRFAPVQVGEVAGLRIHISLLTVPERLTCLSEADLLQQVRPGVDGLILESAGRRGTLLPAVWEVLPEAREFVRQLKLKAGLAPAEWPADMVVYRYTAESIQEP